MKRLTNQEVDDLKEEEFFGCNHNYIFDYSDKIGKIVKIQSDNKNLYSICFFFSNNKVSKTMTFKELKKCFKIYNCYNTKKIKFEPDKESAIIQFDNEFEFVSYLAQRYNRRFGIKFLMTL